MAMVVLGIAAAGVLLPFTSGASVRAEGQRRTLAAKLAADLMEEVVKTPFGDIVDKYNHTETQGQVKDSSGAVFTDDNYACFSRTVSCTEVYVPQESQTGAVKFILAIVQVDYNGREIAVINRLISK